MSGSAGPSQVGVSALGYPSGLADPPDSSAYGGGEMSTSLATGIVGAEVMQLEQSAIKLESSSSSLAAALGPDHWRQQLASRQRPATVATETAAAEGPTIATPTLLKKNLP